MSTFTDGARPSVAPGSGGPDVEPPEDASTPQDDGSAWLREEMARRIAARNSGGGGRHARRATVDAKGDSGAEAVKADPARAARYVPRHSVDAPPAPAPPTVRPVPPSPTEAPPNAPPLSRERAAAKAWPRPLYQDNVHAAPNAPATNAPATNAPATNAPATNVSASNAPAPPRAAAPPEFMLGSPSLPIAFPLAAVRPPVPPLPAPPSGSAAARLLAPPPPPSASSPTPPHGAEPARAFDPGRRAHPPKPSDDDEVLWSASAPPAEVVVREQRSTAVDTGDGNTTEKRGGETRSSRADILRGARFPRLDEPDTPVPGKRVRVVLAERKGVARPVRTVVDIQEGTGVGELLRSGLIGSQLSVALRFAVGAGLTLGLLPLLFALFPEIGRFDVFGLRLPWLLLGLLVYPFLLGLGWWHTRIAERVEQGFADHVQD